MNQTPTFQLNAFESLKAWLRKVQTSLSFFGFFKSKKTEKSFEGSMWKLLDGSEFRTNIKAYLDTSSSFYSDLNDLFSKQDAWMAGARDKKAGNSPDDASYITSITDIVDEKANALLSKIKIDVKHLEMGIQRAIKANDEFNPKEVAMNIVDDMSARNVGGLLMDQRKLKEASEKLDRLQAELENLDISHSNPHDQK